MDVDRGFVRIREGLVHYHHAGELKKDGLLPLLMMHAAPGSSKSLFGHVASIGETRKVVAMDTLGYGDSSGPELEEPDLIYYADSVARVLDMLGLDKIDVYGSHTGANVGAELAIAHPDRVHRMVFDGVALFDRDLAHDMLENYAPKIRPDEHGGHLMWVWHFLRDMGQFFPHYKKDAKHQMNNSIWSPELITQMAVEVLKNLDTYYKGYNAVFRHNTHERLPLVTVPTLCMAHKADPLHAYVEEAAALMVDSRYVLLPKTAGLADKVKAVVNFLDE